MSNIKLASLPTNITFNFHFSESDMPVDINNAVLQQYPDYLSLVDDTYFFTALNNKLDFFHEIDHLQNGFGEIQSFVTDSQGRIFEVALLHQQGVPT